MTEKDVIASLQAIQSELRNILNSDAPGVIDSAIYKLQKSKERYDETRIQTHLPEHSKPDDWALVVSQARPLRFQPIPCNGHTLLPDVFCELRWEGTGRLVKQDIALRVWSLDLDLSYREDWDSIKIFDHLYEVDSSERVIFRCHFDLANFQQPGPVNHLQIGGNGEMKEKSWFPQSVKIPRFAHPPMDLLLVCQMVAANFFPAEYSRVKKSPGWYRRVSESEQFFWKAYYERCQKYFNESSNKETWLDVFWNK
jgi:hypothetical protein